MIINDKDALWQRDSQSQANFGRKSSKLKYVGPCIETELRGIEHIAQPSAIVNS
jgi:hypothetical protein